MVLLVVGQALVDTVRAHQDATAAHDDRWAAAEDGARSDALDARRAEAADEERVALVASADARDRLAAVDGDVAMRTEAQKDLTEQIVALQAEVEQSADEVRASEARLADLRGCLQATTVALNEAAQGNMAAVDRALAGANEVCERADGSGP